jgi:hypothetical protein
MATKRITLFQKRLRLMQGQQFCHPVFFIHLSFIRSPITVRNIHTLQHIQAALFLHKKWVVVKP